MDLLTIKLGMLAAILAAGALGGAVPLLRAFREHGGFLSNGNAFAAGVILGTGLIHLLPAAETAWEELGWEYPAAYLLAAVAFAGILLFEHVLLPEPAHEMVHAHPGDSLTHREMHAVSHSVYPFMLLAALSGHSVIEGVALGSQDALPSVLLIFVAVIAHKATAGFALGMSLARHEIGRRRSLGLIGLFSTMTPAGILLGMAAGGVLGSTAERYFDAALLALAAGTFIYIAALDILQDEFLRPGSRFLKWLFTALGIAVTGILAIWG